MSTPSPRPLEDIKTSLSWNWRAEKWIVAMPQARRSARQQLEMAAAVEIAGDLPEVAVEFASQRAYNRTLEARSIHVV